MVLAVSGPAAGGGTPFHLRHGARETGARACKWQLGGRTLVVPPDIRGFGIVQGLPPLPLQAGEYALSIDDGPSPDTTGPLLAILRGACVHATFFLTGEHAAAYPELVRAILADGHTVGSHSLNHANFVRISEAERRHQVLAGAEAVDLAVGQEASGPVDWRWFRPPGGDGVPPRPPESLQAFLLEKRFVIAGYDISPQDWRNDPPQVSFDRMFTNLPDRGVILLHDGPLNTLSLLPEILEELARRRANIVTLRRGTGGR